MYKIDSLDHYGRGITKVDGKITFIENALKEEVVDIRLIKENKKYNEGYVLKYIEKSKDRVNVNCPYYSNCGGCNIMHMSYKSQLEFKKNKVISIIKKYLKDNIVINDIVPSNKIFNYRNKVTFQVNKNIGFYKNNTYELIPIDNCLISHELINNSIKYLKKLDLSLIEKITCRVATNKLMIIIESKSKNIDIQSIKEIANSIYLKVKDSYIHIFGEEYLIETIGDYKYIISPDSFFQINIDVCLKLYNKIKEYAKKNKNILDLYCGTGTIGIFVSDNNNIIGVEKNKYAIDDACKNIKLNNLSDIKFICGDSGKEISKLNFNPDLIVIDPPRSGLNKETLNNILKFNSKEIVYVSCDPMTLVRDLNILKEKYNIDEITPFDMFPNTYHVETITHLSKKV